MKGINQTYLIGFLVFAVVAVILYSIIKEKTENPDLPGASTNNDDVKRYKSIARSVYNSLSGYNWGNTAQRDAFQKLIDLNDTDLIGVHNAYKNLFGDTDYPTIRTLIEGEWMLIGELAQMKEEVYQRLSALGA